MKKLSDIVSKNGFTYRMLQRTEKKALYAQYYQNTLIGFEVFLIRIRGAQFSYILNKTLPPAERFPGNEDFGRTAWSIQKYEDAIIRFNKL